MGPAGGHDRARHRRCGAPGRFAPFPRYLKVLLLFSYYFGYEYGVLSRSYTLGWFLLCLFCAAYHPLRLRHAILAVALSLLVLTSVYGVVMGVALILFLVWEHLRLWSSSPPRILSLGLSSRVGATAIVVSASVVFCLLYWSRSTRIPSIRPGTGRY